jgi:hypothetical protein
MELTLKFPMNAAVFAIVSSLSWQAAAEAPAEDAPNVFDSPCPATAFAPAAFVPVPPARSWYGYETLIADGGSLAAIMVGGDRKLEPVLWAGIGGLFLASPVVHAVHGRPLAGLASLTMRTAIPLTAMTGVYLLAPKGGDNNWGTAIVAVAAGGLGLASAIAIDSAVLAFDPPKDRASRSATASSVQVRGASLAPSERGRGLSASLSGTF